MLPAQSYESIFGKNSTLWIIKWNNLDFGGIDSIVVQKDTLIDNIPWKKIINKQPYSWSGGLLREDTLSGKVWYKPLEFLPDTEYLAFDYSLIKGDTFNLSSNYNPKLMGVVDSFYLENSTNHIRFNSSVHPSETEQITWIEGVSGNQGPFYKESHLFLWPYLLCAYKDGVQTYSNLRHNGNCNPIISGTTSANEAPEFQVFPNPFQSHLFIDCPSLDHFESFDIFNQKGILVDSGRFQTLIEIQNSNPGIYILRLVTENGKVASRVVIRN